MRLYVANLSAQRVSFNYLVPDEQGALTGGGYRTQDIPLGMQVAISGDLTQKQIDYIIKKHRKYGLVTHTEIRDQKDFTGTCYSIDMPVPRIAIADGLKLNLAVLTERGRQYRQEAAIAVSNAMETQLQESGRPEGLRELAMEVVEEEPRGGYQSEKPLGEGVLVSRAENGQGPPRQQRRRGSARAAA